MLCWRLEWSHLLTLYHCGFCISFGFRWVVEDQTGTKGGDSSLPDGLFGVPHSHKDIVKEGRLHLLEEEGGDADGQLTEHQDLGGKAHRDLASGSESSVLS